MDKQRCIDFVETLMTLLSNNSPTVCEYGDNVFFEYRPRKENTPSSSLETRLNNFLDLTVDGSVVIAHRGKSCELDITDTADISQMQNSSQTQKKRQASSTNSEKGRRNSFNESISSGDNLDGSPLKLHAYADLSCFDSPSSVSSPKYIEPVKYNANKDSGISTQQARCMLSMYCTSVSKRHRDTKKTDMIPDFWILCDASDVKSTIIMGAELVEVDGVVAGLRTTAVTLSYGETNLAKRELKNAASNAADAQCYARYNVIESTTNDGAEYHGTLAVDLEWKKATTLMQKPPFNATASIKASVHAGDMRSPVYSFFQELTVLKSFVSAVTTGDVDWIPDQSDVPLVDRVKALIDQLKQVGRLDDATSEDEKDVDDLMSSLQSLTFRERKDLDFTDRLWKVLITCSSYSDLVRSLQLVFNSLGVGGFLPMVHSNNHTTVAQLVRDSYTGRMITPSLKGITPMKLLAEIGAEKLKRDYMNAFVSANLTTLSVLTQMGSTSTTAATLDQQAGQLEKQQMVLEMVSMLKLFLSLPTACLGAIARQMLKHYETSPADGDHVFEFSVATSNVTSVLDKCSPSVWKARVDVTSGSVTEAMLYCVTRTVPFLHVQNKFWSQAENDNDSETSQYFLMKKHDFVTLF